MQLRKTIPGLCLILICQFSYAHEGKHESGSERFLENKGQWHENVKYKVEIEGGDFYLENNGFTFHFYDFYNVHPHNPKEPSGVKGHNYRVQFIEANSSPKFKNGKASFTNYNFYYGKDPKKWVSGAKAYSYVKYKDIYKAIDVKLYEYENFIKYDFIVGVDSDPSKIKMKYEGVNDIYIADRQLVVKHNLGYVIEQQPMAYQVIDGKTVDVKCEFLLNESVVSFKFPEGYNRKYPLTIDPTLIFSTFSGSKSDNWGMTATYDKFGNAYNGGTVFGPNYLIPTGGYDSTFNNNMAFLVTDVAIRKYSEDGSQIYYSTYLGGSSSELVHSMIVNYNDELIVFGATGSSDFPTKNAYDYTFNGGSEIYALAHFINGTDIYITKFSADGLAIEGSTYIGGSENDGLNYEVTYDADTTRSNYSDHTTRYQNLLYNYGDQARGEVELDQFGYIYIASQTHSFDFPTVNPLYPNLNGIQDAILLKLNSNLSSLLYSTFFGGSESETGLSVKIDNNNDIFIGGGSTSNDLTTTAGSYSNAYNGGISDGYIAKIDSSGQNLIAATFIGDTMYDQVFNIDVDRFGNPYFLAQSLGGNFPIKNAQFSIPNGAQAFGKLSINLDSMIFSSKIGNKRNNNSGNGRIDITPTAFLVDRCQNIYISGWGGTIDREIYRPLLNNMPITSDAFKNTTHGYNFYIAVIKRNADSLLFGTYFGGTSGSREHVDGGTSRFDERGVVYQSVCAGCNGTNNFITKNALFPTNGTIGALIPPNCNNAIFKFDLEILPKARFTTSKDTGCSPLTVQFDDQSLRSDQFHWDFGNNDTTSTVRNPIRTFTTPGKYLVKLAVTDSICQSTDTAYKYIIVYSEVASYSLTDDTIVCSKDSVELAISSKGSATEFIWSSNRSFTDTLNSTSDSTIKIVPNSEIGAYYYIKAKNPNCALIDSVWVKLMEYEPSFSPPIDSVCSPANIALEAQNTGATFYGYEFSDGSTFPMQNNISKSFIEPGTYQGFYTAENSFCNLRDTFHFTVEVLQGIDVETSSDTTICFGDSIQVFGNAFGKANKYIWSKNQDFSQALNNFSDSSIMASTQQALDTFYFKASNSFCEDSTVFHLNMEQVLLDIDAEMILCLGDTGNLSAVDMSNVSPINFNWQPAIEVISGQGTANISSSPTADMEFRLIGTSPYGCTDTAFHFLDVEEANFDTANIFASEDTIFKGQTVTLYTDQEDPNLVYIWSPSNEVDFPNSNSTTASPNQTTEYTLEIFDKLTGCTITVFKRIVVREIHCGEPEIFIPTAFTPNGDQNNDKFMVKGNIVEELNISIYNRWGQKIFETFDQNNAWDGSYQGMAVDPGVFVYHLHLRCFDGQDFFKKGNVTLIR